MLLAAATVCPAALIPIGISPAGTDAAIGLSPSNEVPPVVNSTGSGGPISGGLVFDTDASKLMLTIGYGSVPGFSNLTGPATTITLNGPARTNQNAGVLFDLTPFHFPALDPADGGVIFVNVTVNSNSVPDLLAGLDYVSVCTASNVSGEIRGQLVPLVPIIDCPEPVMVQCGSSAGVSVSVYSAVGNAMSVVWSVDGMPVQTNQVPASHPPAEVTVGFTGDLPAGTNQIDIVVTDSAGATSSCSTTVTVADTTPPVIVSASASPNSLWPPNHNLVPINLSVVATDNCAVVSWKIIGVQSNEPVNGVGDGNTGTDWQITGDHTLLLRAERAGTGTGRVYTITLRAQDAAGNLSAAKTVTVTVPKSQGKNKI